MRNKSILPAVVLVALLIIFQQSATAQQQQLQTPQQGQDRGAQASTPKERAMELQQQLTLTEEQTAEVVKIYESTNKRRIEVNRSSMSDVTARRQALQELTKQEDAEIEALLNAEQLAKYEDLKKKRDQQKPIWQ